MLPNKQIVSEPSIIHVIPPVAHSPDSITLEETRAFLQSRFTMAIFQSRQSSDAGNCIG